MWNNIVEYVKPCHQCQMAKRGLRGYGKVPVTDIKQRPWHNICVDLVGPWKANVDGKDVYFHSLTMIDPFTSWVEIVPIKSKKKEHVRDLFEQEWLRRYPRPAPRIS